MPRKTTKRPLTPRQTIEAEILGIDRREDLEERAISREAAKLDRELLKAQRAYARALKSHERRTGALVRRKNKMNDGTARRRSVLLARLAAL